MRSVHLFPKLQGRPVLSPMAGVTNVAFRTLAKKYGAAITYTEFVSSAALVRNSKKTHEMLITDPTEKPVAVQLFGNNIQEVIEAAKIIQDDFDIIDINCGCPAWKVIRSGAGSELLKTPERISSIVNQLVSAVSKPVTVKIRIGINEETINAIEVAKAIEDAGAEAIAVHGRTQQQGYTGTSNWEIIKQVKEAVSIPVIGNGDVFTPEDYKTKLEYSQVDGIMIARGAMTNPYIFQQIQDYMKKGEYTSKNKIELYKEYYGLAKKYNIAYPEVRGHFLQFTKGMQRGALLRQEAVKLNKQEDFEKFLESLKSS